MVSESATFGNRSSGRGHVPADVAAEHCSARKLALKLVPKSKDGRREGGAGEQEKAGRTRCLPRGRSAENQVRVLLEDSPVSE